MMVAVLVVMVLVLLETQVLVRFVGFVAFVVVMVLVPVMVFALVVLAIFMVYPAVVVCVETITITDGKPPFRDGHTNVSGHQTSDKRSN